jgi:hypothetical protein
MPGYTSLCPRNESVELFLGHPVFLQDIIIGMNSDWPKRNDLITMQNSDVFAVGGAFQQ